MYYWEIIEKVVGGRRGKGNGTEKMNNRSDGIFTMRVLQLHMTQAVPSSQSP